MRWPLLLTLLSVASISLAYDPPFSLWPRDYGVKRSNDAIRVDVDALKDTLVIQGFAQDTLKGIQFTIINPHLVQDTLLVVWTNVSDDTAQLLGLRAWTSVNDFNFTLYEYNSARTYANRSLLIAPEIDFYTSGELTGFTDDKVAPGNLIVYHVDNLDTATQVKIAIRAQFTGTNSPAGGCGGDGDSCMTWGDTLNGIATQYDLSQKVLHFTLSNPSNFPGDSCIVWSNATGYAVALNAIRAWSTTDDFNFTLKEYTASGGSAGGTVEAVTVSNNGTNCYYTDEITAIDHATIENTNTLWMVTSEDSSAWIKCAIRYTISLP